MPRETSALAERPKLARHELWAKIEIVIRSQCQGVRKPPGFKHSSTRTYILPGANELTVQVFPRNCMIQHGSVIFPDIPREQILLYLRAFIKEKQLTRK